MIKVCSGDPTTCDIYGVKTGLAAHLGERWYPNTKPESLEKQAQRIMVNSGFPAVWDGYAWNFNCNSVDAYMCNWISQRAQIHIAKLQSKFLTQVNHGTPPDPAQKKRP